MQTAQTTLSPQSETLRLGSAAAQRMIVPGLVLAAIGAAVALLCGFRVEHAPTLFYHAYLVAFVFYLTITLGSLFFVLLHHLSRAGWSVTLRRLAEALSGNVALMALLFLPIIFGLREIYPWAEPQTAEHQSSNEAQKGNAVEVSTESKETPAVAEATSGESHHASVGHEIWLTPVRFIGRFVIYFVIWGFLVWYFRGHSILQDRTGNVRLSKSMERLSAPGMILFAFTITLAAVDLIMSLNPHWYSTMIGVYLFSDAVLSSLVVLTLLAMWLQSNGLLHGVVTVEHYHDLGKLTFAFVFFWGFIAFSQYMLIWYANIPEETQFYMSRQIGPWAGVSLALIVVHFVLPFLGLMSKHVKRLLPLFAFWLIWLLVAHAFDLYWLIMPNIFVRQIGEPLPEAFKTLLESQQSVYRLAATQSDFIDAIVAPLQPAAIATVIGLLIAMGGLFLANTAWLLKGAALVPVRDSRLNESLSFHNT
ncbi:MAG: hypothetical protein ACLP9L_36135 [Thermoguttaceae bacterium]